jgi:hypothetical protein
MRFIPSAENGSVGHDLCFGALTRSHPGELAV